jgi:hypothetical protein
MTKKSRLNLFQWIFLPGTGIWRCTRCLTNRIIRPFLDTVSGKVRDLITADMRTIRVSVYHTILMFCIHKKLIWIRTIFMDSDAETF